LYTSKAEFPFRLNHGSQNIWPPDCATEQNQMMEARLCSLLISALLAIAPSYSFQITSAQQAILQRTNQAYYNLPSQGLVEFQCVVVPDWSVTLKEELHQDFPPDHPAIKALNGIHFWSLWTKKVPPS
jgi:hypothetical protein